MLINTTNIPAYLDSIALLLEHYLELFPEDRERLSVLRNQAESRSSELCHRRGLPGHLTASALVFNPSTRRFLLIRHNFLKRWLQPGGHMDFCEEPIAAACRELQEEVGELKVELHRWQITNGVPLDIDSHQIPANDQKREPEHLHHDFQYLFLLPKLNQNEKQIPIALQEDEVSDFRWAPLAELQQGEYGRRLARTVEKMIRLGFAD
jgi:8-oxo-dGTP pyrophosphatase MutT (NUDIX family)